MSRNSKVRGDEYLESAESCDASLRNLKGKSDTRRESRFDDTGDAWAWPLSSADTTRRNVRRLGDVIEGTDVFLARNQRSIGC